MALLAVVGQVLASAVLEPLLERVLSAAADELRLVRGFRKEIRKLDSTLTLIRRVLEDAEKRQVGETAVGVWLRQLKQVFLDADDLLDEYATDAALQSAGVEGRPGKFGCFTCIRRTMSDRAMAHQMREVNERLDHLARQKDNLRLQASLPMENSRLEYMRRPPTSSLLADENSVIGRDSEKKMIIELLLASAHEVESNNNRSFCVLPIVGMGGMGKTILAKLVFKDENVKKHFELRMWVCVSNDFDVTRLTKEMIDAAFASIGNNEPSQQFTTHWDSMQQKLRQRVEGRTFLLVLDDVWQADRSQWENLFEPLKFGSKGSKIVITTRNRDVVDKIQGRMDPIRLGGLSDADIWLLFKRYAFDGVTNSDGTINTEHFHLEDIGRYIVGRLKGSPLAARTMGSLLNTKVDAQHWKTILNNSEMWTLAQEADDILPVLGLSYQYLRADLKQCFAYCSLFPKDYVFGKQELVRLWNAQCFVRMERGTVMEATGNKYVDNLLQRSFLEPSMYSEIYYVMHDLMHDLAEYVSKDDCLRLEDQKSMRIPDTVRHISSLVTKFDTQKLKELCRHEKLRTLLFLRSCEFDNLTHALDELFLKLKRLRVLGLSRCGIKALPSSIGDLKHLRYIDLSENPLTNLPESLGNLHNLQVLNLKYCDSLRALPSRMSELLNLSHLTANHELVSNIDGVGKLTGLQEVKLTGRKVRELGGMSMLRRLHISRLEEVGKEEAVQARLDSKEHLQELRLCWEDGRDATSVNSEVEEEEVLQALRPADSITDLSIDGYKGAKSPSWLEDPTARTSEDAAAGRPLFVFPCLRVLLVSDCPKLRELPSLSPTLTHLTLHKVGLTSLPGLWRCYRGGGNGDETSSSYPSSASAALSELRISDCSNLTFLSGLLGHHLTVLKELIIHNCQELASLPEKGFGHLISLKLLSIWRCPKLTCPSFVPEDDEEEDVDPPLSLSRSLEQLEIVKCGDSMGSWWWKGLQHLTSLAEMTLDGCPNTVASLFLSLGRHHHHLAATLTKLEIRHCGFDHQQESSSSTSSPLPPAHPPTSLADAATGFPALTSLTELRLCRSPNLLRKCGIRGLPSSLRYLRIVGDDNLNDEFLFACLRDLSSLEALSITDVENLCSMPSMLSCVTFLETLGIYRCHQIQSLPEMASPRLKRLAICFCENLRFLPATLSCLSSLEVLNIVACDKIESLPETGLPASLRVLDINRCPSLAARCGDEECPDWPKIRYIPKVFVDHKRII